MTDDQRTEALARLRAELIEGGLIEDGDDVSFPISTLLRVTKDPSTIHPYHAAQAPRRPNHSAGA